MTGDRAKCYAKGCPCWPSVQRDGDKALCSAHAWSKPASWPAITDEMVMREHDRAAYGDAHRPEATHTLTPEQVRDMAEALRKPGVTDATAWAYRLRARHQAGSNLTQAQIEAYKAVTGDAAVPTQQDAWA